MREIKFRVWDNKENKMFERVEHSLAFYDNSFTGGCSKEEQNKFVLMQYTGLKDKNGKEIYFDDYVKDENFSANTFIVKWNETKISLLNISNGDIIDIDSINNLIVKSNIYENIFSFTPKYREIS